MAEGVGKKVFKRHLDVFLEPMFDTISRITTSQLARHAASSCVRRLSGFVGPSIFRGRLTESQREVREKGLWSSSLEQEHPAVLLSNANLLSKFR